MVRKVSLVSQFGLFGVIFALMRFFGHLQERLRALPETPRPLLSIKAIIVQDYSFKTKSTLFLHIIWALRRLFLYLLPESCGGRVFFSFH